VTARVDITRTRAIQWEASDPTASAWVVANAGSGKTHVLTQRVVRLLLAGADAAAILCLTFTKVAAAEMSRRIFETLGRWTTLSDKALAAEIENLQGSRACLGQIRAARRLFARALETPGGLKIQTIHGLCERLLHQFPFEANVPGQFSVLDETAAAALIAQARAGVMADAARLPDSRLGLAVRYLAEHAADQQIEAGLDCLIAKRDLVRRWIERTGTLEDALVDLRERLGVAADENEASVCAEICRSASWDRGSCGALADALAEALSQAEHGHDRAAWRALQELLDSAEPQSEAERRLAFFLTEASAGWRARSVPNRFSAAFARSQAGVHDRFAAEAERLVELTRRLAAARSFAATEALLVVGDAILQAYAAAKKNAGQLDFADLVGKTRNLLSRGEAAAWVLYKLDARIEHILVDEAQDTSPDQWSVVQALAADFFAGAGAARANRTVFAVGDDKQSIYGFQGAAPHMLAEMELVFRRAAEGAMARFVRRPLSLSFRSTSEVLAAVDTVFKGPLEAKVTASGYELHSAHRLEEPGEVVVLPRIVRRKRSDPEDWTEPFDAPTAAEVELADQIGDEIATLRARRLASGKPVRDGQILILVRRRDSFVWAMNRALRERRIAAAGADRIPVATHIAALDLLALADFVLLPEDDLQLAALLKSPLIGLSEDELLELAQGRSGTLWSALRRASADAPRAAAAKLKRWRALADQVPPFGFFAAVLGPDGGRQAFRARLGPEADDVLDALLSQALAYEAIEPPSLQGFLRFIRASQSDLKREVEETSAGVRIMTVHGAKGLEADVVFLVDTGGQIVAPVHRDPVIEIADPERGPAFLWRRARAQASALQLTADQLADEETRKEYLRLLYVGMTRARDVLYVAGIRGEKREEEGCWYSVVAGALVPETAERDPAAGELLAPYRWPQPPRAAGREKPEPDGTPTSAPTEVPEWLLRPAPSPEPPPAPLRPSGALAEPDLERPAADRSGSLDPESARRHGRLVHMLIQHLPAVSPGERADAAERLLARELPDDEAARIAIRGEAEAVIALPELADAFGPHSRAEIPIVGTLRTERGDYAVSGRMDRLVRERGGWHVVDFKTARAVPDTADPDLVLQVALYCRLLADMEPGAATRASLVWTAGPKIMPVPSQEMERALEKLGIRATPFP